MFFPKPELQNYIELEKKTFQNIAIKKINLIEKNFSKTAHIGEHRWSPLLMEFMYEKKGENNDPEETRGIK